MVKQNYKKYAFPALMILALVLLGVSMQSGLLAGEKDVSDLVSLDKNVYNYGDTIEIVISNPPAVLNYADMPVKIWGGDWAGLGNFPLYYSQINTENLYLEIDGQKTKYSDAKIKADETKCRPYSYDNRVSSLVCMIYEFNPVLYGTGFLKSDIFTVEKQQVLSFSIQNYMKAGNKTLELHWTGEDGVMSGVSAVTQSRNGHDPFVLRKVGTEGLFASKTFEVLPSNISDCLGETDILTADGRCINSIQAEETCMVGQSRIGNNCEYLLRNYDIEVEPQIVYVDGEIQYIEKIIYMNEPLTNIHPSQPPSTDVNIDDNLFAVASACIIFLSLAYLILSRKK